MVIQIEHKKDFARALAALGHEARLDVFRLLVRAGDEGLIVSEIAEHTGLAASTLAHHLKTLVNAELVVQERQGREILSRANYDVMNRTLAFLTSECCKGVDLGADLLVERGADGGGEAVAAE